MPDAMIVAPQPEAVEAGALVLRDGGNAVDAAIACALVQGAVDPMMTGVAGFGSLHAYLPGQGVHALIDFHARAPAAVRPDMWESRIEGEARDGFGFILRGRVNDLGYQSIATPGSLLGYYEAQTAWGKRSWKEVLAPAIAWAERGFVVRPRVHHFWTMLDDSGRTPVEQRLAHTEASRRIYFADDGALRRVGERVRNPDMARTLQRLADSGADAFYHGEIADEIDADMRANGGLLRKEDLAGYATVHGDALEGRYRGRRVATNRPPGGGVMLIEMLQALEHFDLAALGHNTPAYIRTVAEVMKRATADKDRHVGDPLFVDVPLARLIDPDYARELAESVRSGERAHVERVSKPESAHTTHVSVVDGEGGAVSMTHSLGMPSGVVTPGLGFTYNGCMGVFDPRPGRAGSLAPGKSRFSSMCPTILFDSAERPELVIGAPGGTQIAMGVLQVILNAIDFGMPIDRAVAAPRFSATSNAIDVSNRIPAYVSDEIENDGYEVVRSPLSYHFAGVHAIGIESGELCGGADPGLDGMALGVDVRGSAR